MSFQKGASTVAEEDDEEEEDIDFDEDFEGEFPSIFCGHWLVTPTLQTLHPNVRIDDEEDMLEHFLAEQTGKSSA